jgi:hypothetical protein
MRDRCCLCLIATPDETGGDRQNNNLDRRDLFGIRVQQRAAVLVARAGHGAGRTGGTRIDARRVITRWPLLRTRTRTAILPEAARSIRTVTRRRSRLRGASDARRQQTLPFRRRAPRVALTRVVAAGGRRQILMGPAAPGPRLMTATVIVNVDPAPAVAALTFALTESLSGSS